MEEIEVQNDTIDISPPGKVSYKDIVIGQFLKCSVFCNVEFRGGYWTRMSTKDGGSKLFYNPDTRDVLCNALYSLSFLLLPKFDETMKKYFKEHKRLLKLLQDEFMKASSVDENIILGESFYTKAEDKVSLEEYRQKKLQLFLSLFSALSELLARLNYLELMGGTF